MFSTAAGSLGRALSAVTLSLALSVGYLSVEALPAQAADTFEIYDPGLAMCVSGSIPGYSGDGMTFTAAELLTVTQLWCEGYEISDLSELQGLQNVTDARFDNNNISDLYGIGFLFSLQTLSVSGNQLTDLSELNSASHLTTLNAANNHLLDLSTLFVSETLTSVTATGQTGSWTIAPNTASPLPLRDWTGSLPTTITSSDPSLTIAAGEATGTAVGSYTITFADNEYGADFGGTLTTIVDAGPVTIPDAGFAACLDDKLGVTGNIFGSVELATITSLDCSYRNISDLTGASALRDATSLDFSHNAITNAGPIGANAALKTLNLSYNQLSTLNAVPTMQIETLDVSYNRIANVSPLSVITTLTTLDARGQSLEATVEADTATDLTVLDWAAATPTFNWPTGVTYDSGQVTAAAGIYGIDFSSTAGAKTFSGTLTLSSHVEITIPDAHLAQCIAVALNKTPSTTTFSNLDLAGILELSCANRSVMSLDGLEYLTSLIHLDLSYNLISDVSPLSGLTGLMDLHLTHNNISDASPLAGVTSVANLYLNENNLSSIADLSTLTNVAVLDVSSNRLTSLTGVAGKIWLYNLKASGNELTSLAPISALTRLDRRAHV
jgi:internalin A